MPQWRIVSCRNAESARTTTVVDVVKRDACLLQDAQLGKDVEHPVVVDGRAARIQEAGGAGEHQRLARQGDGTGEGRVTLAQRGDDAAITVHDERVESVEPDLAGRDLP